MIQTAKQKLKNLITRLYLWSCFTYIKFRLKPGTPSRDFSRVRIISAFQRHNGISMGATLQAEAMRRRNIDGQTLDATAVIRNLAFRIPHQPGTAYIFHAGGPQIANLMLSVLPAVSTAYN